MDKLFELEEKDQKIRDEITKYFGAIAIGSQRLNLHCNTINDIDFAVDNDNETGLYEYLKDKGYSSKKGTGRDGYPSDKILIFSKNKCKNIDVTFFKKSDNFKLYSNAEIIKRKYERGTKNDLYQIMQVCQNIMADRQKPTSKLNNNG